MMLMKPKSLCPAIVQTGDENQHDHLPDGSFLIERSRLVGDLIEYVRTLVTCLAMAVPYFLIVFSVAYLMQRPAVSETEHRTGQLFGPGHVFPTCACAPSFHYPHSLRARPLSLQAAIRPGSNYSS